MHQQFATADVVLRALSELPQSSSIRAERSQLAAARMSTGSRSRCELALRELRGLTTPEIGVLVHEARGIHDSRTSARTIARSKLLERAPEVLARHPALDVALPLAASLLTQGHGAFALDLTHSAVAARLSEEGSSSWLLPDPAIQFVRMPSLGGAPRIGLAYVRPVSSPEEAAEQNADASLALSLAAYAAVADGVLASRPEALFVLNVVAPGLDAWAPLLRASPAVAEAVRSSLLNTAWSEVPPVSLRPVAARYDMHLVRDALKVGDGFWERCVLGGAVPALPARAAPAAKLASDREDRARHLAQQYVCLERLAHGLGERMEVQRQALAALAVDSALAVGAHGVGATEIVVTDRLDVAAAAEELRARGVSDLAWSAVDWDVDGMRSALEGLGVDVAGFARAGVPEVDRMTEALGPDAQAFLVREVAIARSALSNQPGLAHADGVADELVSNVSELVFDLLRGDGMDADGAAQPGARAA